ncbi:hypothetical protein [Streptomyces sp. NPDC029704]|uniref:hypothetical protein n=1 Tax=Streptomyces sp. NPDC029704 TaxID=3156920 RepID=UPI0033E1ECDC
MVRKQIWAVITVVVTVLVWSVVMATLGHAAAIATLVPSLGLLVQQIIQSTAGPGAKAETTAPPAPTASGKAPGENQGDRR